MKWLHNVLKVSSLTAALFVFQACYGTGPAGPMYEDGQAPMSFSIVSRATGEPIEGVKVLSDPLGFENLSHLGTSGADGKCSVTVWYFRNQEGPFVRFQDAEGRYAVKDTTFSDLRPREIVVKLDPVGQ